jgi:hypothetical protein
MMGVDHFYARNDACNTRKFTAVGALYGFITCNSIHTKEGGLI